MALLLFSGYPVAFILGGLALLYGLIGYLLGVFSLIEFFNFLPRIWGQAAENLVLVAVPTFVFMGVMMERSGIANDLLYTVQVLLKRVPGALALAVTIMGTILAAMTGIIGASVTMMTALALPTMMRQGYSHALACGTIAASGTLGILIPPSIMLIIMADLMSVSVGNVFMAAWGPGLSLVALYLIFVLVIATVKPSHGAAAAARPAARAQGRDGSAGAQGVPAAGVPDRPDQGRDPVRLVDAERGRRGRRLRRDCCSRCSTAGSTTRRSRASARATGRTIAMIFFIIISATCFAYVYRSLGGDDIVEDLIISAGLGSWGLLFLIMGIVFFLGFFLDWIEITLIVLPVFAPLVAGLDFGDHVAKERHDPLVHHPDGGQPADLVPDPALRLRPVLSQGHRAARDQDPEHLQGHHPVRHPAADRAGGRHALSQRRPVADASRSTGRR